MYVCHTLPAIPTEFFRSRFRFTAKVTVTSYTQDDDAFAMPGLVPDDGSWVRALMSDMELDEYLSFDFDDDALEERTFGYNLDHINSLCIGVPSLMFSSHGSTVRGSDLSLLVLSYLRTLAE